MADKALVYSGNGSLVVMETVVASVPIPRFVSEGGVQLDQVTLRREHELRGMTVDHVLCVKQLFICV